MPVSSDYAKSSRFNAKQDHPYAKNQFDPVVELPNSIISNKSIEEI